MNSIYKIILIFIFIGWSAVICAQTIDLEVEWNHSLRAIPSHAYGVNSPANFDPTYSNNPTYMQNLATITQNQGMVRLHGWGMLGDSPEAWQEAGVWDAEKIQSALTPLVAQGYTIMINIPSGPMGEDDYQNPEVFAQFCADLVQIVNVDLGLGVQYWELPNEREQAFTSPGLSVMQMATLINTASTAMKTIDPTIRVGGVATAWVNIGFLTQLVEMTLPNIDFITCHTYSGDCNNSLLDAYNVAQYAVEDLKTLREDINLITGNEYLPIFLTEYNISYQGCDYIQSNEGAVYDAVILSESMKSGIDGTCYWAIAPYSDMSVVLGNDLIGNAYLYETYNQYFYGNMMRSTSSDSTQVLIYATTDPAAETYAFCIINRTATAQNIQLNMVDMLPDTMPHFLWDGDHDFYTDTTSWLALNNGGFTVSPYSVNIFTGDLVLLGIPSVNQVEEQILYPNPSDGILQLSNGRALQSYQIFNPAGALVMHGKVRSNRLDLTRLPAGTYVLRWRDLKGMESSRKVVLE